ERVEQREDAVLLHELTRREERTLRLVPVVHVLVGDLPAEDAAVVVHVLEVGVRALRDPGPRGGLAGERRRSPEQDRVRRHAGSRLTCGARGGGCDGGDERDCGGSERAAHRHLGPLLLRDCHNWYWPSSNKW